MKSALKTDATGASPTVFCRGAQRQNRTSERTVRRLLERFDVRLQSLRSKGALS